MPRFLAKLCVIRGEDNLRRGDLDEALENLDKALKYDRNNLATQKLFHHACNLKARELFENRELVEAKTVIRRGAQYVPNCQGCGQLLLRIEKELDRARRGGPSPGWTPARKRGR